MAQAVLTAQEAATHLSLRGFVALNALFDVQNDNLLFKTTNCILVRPVLQMYLAGSRIQDRNWFNLVIKMIWRDLPISSYL
jgi:hypothetical protein